MVKSIAYVTMLFYNQEAVLSPVSRIFSRILRFPLTFVMLSGIKACNYKVKVKWSLCLTKYYAKKACEGMEV
jgi:hypothetical protein